MMFDLFSIVYYLHTKIFPFPEFEIFFLLKMSEFKVKFI